MNNEFEIKFTNIDEEQIRTALSNLGGKNVQKKKLMRRQTLDYAPGIVPAGEKKWARVRDEGDKITMTIKHITDSKSIDGTKEVELIVNDFDMARDMFVETGLVKASYQENYREEWELDGTMITIDTWPGLEPFIEIEAASKEVAEDVARKLGFDPQDGVFGSIDLIYQKTLGIDPAVVNNNDLTFENFKEVLGL